MKGGLGQKEKPMRRHTSALLHADMQERKSELEEKPVLGIRQEVSGCYAVDLAVVSSSCDCPHVCCYLKVWVCFGVII